jgi:hypothetical protein
VPQQGPQGLVERMEHHQVAVYLAAMAAGALLGWAVPSAGPGLEHAINPVLGALLFVTFLQLRPVRRGAGPRPARLRMSRTVLGGSRTPTPASSPLILT